MASDLSQHDFEEGQYRYRDSGTSRSSPLISNDELEFDWLSAKSNDMVQILPSLGEEVVHSSDQMKNGQGGPWQMGAHANEGVTSLYVDRKLDEPECVN
jgi:hypothetical protein